MHSSGLIDAILICSHHNTCDHVIESETQAQSEEICWLWLGIFTVLPQGASGHLTPARSYKGPWANQLPLKLTAVAKENNVMVQEKDHRC